MSFLQPTYLWGLLSLLVPLVIHLLNKGDVQTIKVGSVRYLTEQETKQTRQIKLNELWLLVLRMLLLAALVFAMASPVWETKGTTVPVTYVVESSLFQTNQLDEVVKEAPEVPLRFLAPGFPSVADGNTVNQTPNYWQLARELQQLESDSIVVFSKASMAGIQGLKPDLPANVFWIPIDELETTDSLISATAVTNGVLLHSVKSDTNHTDLVNEFIPKDQVGFSSADSISVTRDGLTTKLFLSILDTLRIGMYSHKEFQKDKALLSASLRAVGEYTQNQLELIEIADTTKVKETDFDLLVWLHTSLPPKVKGNVLQYQADSLASQLIEKTDVQNVFYLTELLNIENVLHERLTAELAELVTPRPQLAAALARLDKRTLATSVFLPDASPTEAATRVLQHSSMVNWFWMAALMFLVLERVIAKFRKQ